jgi:dipeptidyl-peptidase-4
MRLVLAALLMLSPVLATAAELTIARLYDDPPLAGTLPRALKVSPDGERVTFLRGRDDDQFRMDLWEYNIRAKRERRLVDADLLSSGPEKLSAEEEARRERLRIGMLSGIVDYTYAPDGKQILFPLAGSLYLYDLRKDGAAAVRQLTRAEDGFVTDPKVSPLGNWVSFVRAQTLYALELASGRLLQVSPQGEGAVSYGMAEFVAQEEMSRLTGYWWSPDEARIAYTRIDETPVPIERRFAIHADRTDMVEQRYPAAGKPNALIELHVATLAEAGADGVPAARAVDLGSNRDIYLPRVDWANSRTLTFQRQSRDQRTLELISWAVADGSQRTLLTETSETWVNLTDDLDFLRGGEEFLWTSERSGLRQIYRYRIDGTLLAQVSNTPWAIDNILAVDARKRLVYASAPGPDALERHVYAYRLDGAGDPRRVTREEGVHQAVFAPNARFFIDTHSTVTQPPTVRLVAAEGHLLTVLADNRVDADHPYQPYYAEHVVPEFGTLTAEDGQTLHYALYKPVGFDPGKRHPVLLSYYGGPGLQFVDKGWGDLLAQYFLRRGYIVFSLDNRGTPRRGKRFEDAIFRGMGEIEVRDQRVGIDWLREQPWVAADRIGCYGWSYGGYLSLMLLAKAGDVVRACVAGAPVTDWALYDTHYTERYMDHPEANADGYRRGNVLEYAERIDGELLLIHGMADDNVLFTHSTQLMARLQARPQQFQLMTYPGSTHRLLGKAVNTHAWQAASDFFDRTLKAAPAGESP